MLIHGTRPLGVLVLKMCMTNFTYRLETIQELLALKSQVIPYTLYLMLMSQPTQKINLIDKWIGYEDWGWRPD
jgi:hypothetical protein